MADLSALLPGAQAAVQANSALQQLNRGNQETRMLNMQETQAQDLQSAAPEIAKLAQSGDFMGAYAKLVAIKPDIAATPLGQAFAKQISPDTQVVAGENDQF